MQNKTSLNMAHLVYWFQTVTLNIFIQEFLVLRSGRIFESWQNDYYAIGKYNRMQKKFMDFICELDSDGIKTFPIALENWYNKNHNEEKVLVDNDLNLNIQETIQSTFHPEVLSFETRIKLARIIQDEMKKCFSVSLYDGTMYNKVFEPTLYKDKSENKIALAMQSKGYEFCIIFESENLENLYTKTLQNAIDLMRVDFKDEKNYFIKPIEEIIQS